MAIVVLRQMPMRRRQSRDVASNSYHIKGQAIDFKIPGVPLARLRQAAENLDSGGVGYYPYSNFYSRGYRPCKNMAWCMKNSLILDRTLVRFFCYQQ